MNTCAIARPTTRTMDKTEAINEIAEDMMKWQGSAKDIDEVREDISWLLQRGYSSNGYEHAKELEDRKYYTPDFELVEILDSIGSTLYSFRDKQVRKWVIDNNIQPLFPVGTSVKYQDHNKTLFDAEILRINADTATYVVNVASLGHVKEGVGSHGFLVNFEDLEALNIRPVN